MYINVNQIIYTAADVFFVYTKETPTSFTVMPSYLLFPNFVNIQDQSFHIQKGMQMNLHDRFFSIDLTYFNLINYYMFLSMFLDCAF